MGTAVALLAASCSASVEPVATVLVDYDHDEFATQFLRYFPDTVQARPGDSVTFRQTWTGEPHTVTFGTAVGPVIATTRPLLEEYGHLPEDEVPEEVMREYMQAECQLPHVWPGSGDFCAMLVEGGEPPGEDVREDEPAEDEEPERLEQTAAQPCVVPAGEAIPTDGAPCADRELGAFSGTETFYNSGVIPYEGPSGNVFQLDLSPDIEPGDYPFVCIVHGSFHSGVLQVVDADDPVESPRDVSRRALEEVDEELAPLEGTFARAVSEGRYERGGTEVAGNFAGLLMGEMDGVVNEFIPSEYDVAVGEPVTWKFFGPHSVAFDVPEYFPIVEFADDGTVSYNHDVDAPAGDAPDPGEPPEGPEPWVIDGGTYDGEGFFSSGTLAHWDAWVEYTLRFSEPGEYPFACLIHPPMVGVVRVRG